MKPTKPNDPREEQIAAFVDGEMTDSERAAFERRMEGDAALRRDVEEWREALAAARAWAVAEPPGVERADSIQVPSAAVRSIATRRIGRQSARRPARVVEVSWLRLARRAAAVAAVFVVGFGLGRLTNAPVSGSPKPTNTTPAAGEAVPNAVEVAATPSATVKLAPTNESAPAAAPASRQARHEQQAIASAAPPFYKTEENGRLILETRLRGSGGSATWVVDGRFRMPTP
ncbi:MAG: hypothetical protein NTW86_26265 [Candidatus Sumerlaeota bacterium]|nr:hypothetical protein [Candidatus Sumerlaeota bacterium]